MSETEMQAEWLWLEFYVANEEHDRTLPGCWSPTEPDCWHPYWPGDSRVGRRLRQLREQAVRLRIPHETLETVRQAVAALTYSTQREFLRAHETGAERARPPTPHNPSIEL